MSDRADDRWAIARLLLATHLPLLALCWAVFRATTGLLLGAGFHRSNGSELVAVALTLFLAGLLPGVAVTWALLRDIPIRNRLA